MPANLHRILFPYWILVTSRRFIFGLPCLFLYMEALHITAQEVGFCVSALAISQVLFEVPSGIASDRLGRRLTLVIGATFRSGAWLTFALGTSFPLFLMGFAFLGAAFAFDSGTDSAILFDTLKEHNQEEHYQSYEAKSYTLALLSLGFSNLLGGFFIASGYQFPILLTAFAMIFCLISTFFLHEPQFTKPSGDTVFFAQVREGLKNVLRNTKLLHVTILSVVALGTVEVYFRFIQQFMDHELFIDVRTFGYIYCLWLIVSASASYLMRIETFKKRSLSLIFSLTALLGCMLVIISQSRSSYMIILTFVPQIIYGAIPVLFRSALNKEISSAVRATVLSVFGFLTSCFIAICSPIVGQIETTTRLGSGFMFLGALVIAFTILLGVQHRRSASI